jgi:hypothetical protein
VAGAAPLARTCVPSLHTRVTSVHKDPTFVALLLYPWVNDRRSSRRSGCAGGRGEIDGCGLPKPRTRVGVGLVRFVRLRVELSRGTDLRRRAGSALQVPASPRGARFTTKAGSWHRLTIASRRRVAPQRQHRSTLRRGSCSLIGPVVNCSAETQAGLVSVTAGRSRSVPLTSPVVYTIRRGWCCAWVFDVDPDAPAEETPVSRPRPSAPPTAPYG